MLRSIDEFDNVTKEDINAHYAKLQLKTRQVPDGRLECGVYVTIIAIVILAAFFGLFLTSLPR